MSQAPKQKFTVACSGANEALDVRLVDATLELLAGEAPIGAESDANRIAAAAAPQVSCSSIGS